MPMTPLERKAAFASSVILKETTQERAAREDLGVSAFHLGECLADRRIASEELKQRFADYVERPYEEIWGERPTTQVHVA